MANRQIRMGEKKTYLLMRIGIFFEFIQARRELIEPLITWREYDIQVAAFNDRGLGVFSRPVTISTNEGVPMQSPQNVQILVLNSTAILVTFDPPNPQVNFKSN